MESELNEIKSVIRGLLISTPKAMTIATLKKDYIEEVGEAIPFYKFGYRNLETFLQSINDTVVMQFCPVLNSYTVLPVRSEKSAHVEELVMKQKVSQPASRKKGPRFPMYGSQTRRTLVRRPPALLKPNAFRHASGQITYTTKCNIAKFVSSYPEGVPIHSIMTKFLRDFVTTPQEAEELLQKVEDVEVYNRMVYPTKRKNYGNIEASKNFHQSQPTFHVTKKETVYASPNHRPVENGYSAREPSASRLNSTSQLVPAELDDEKEYFSDVEEINSLIDDYNEGFWEVNKLCKQSSPSLPVSRGEGRVSLPQRTSATVDNSKPSSNGFAHEDKRDDCSPGSYSSLISKRAEENIRYLLGVHSEGILASQFEQKYQDSFGYTFKHQDFGFVSMIQMAAALKHLFKIVAVSGTTDWKLFDAKASVTESDCVNGNPVIPSDVKNQILELVNRHPGGLESSQLEQRYEASYRSKLNPQGMGFADLEACLMALFDDLSLKYVNGNIYIHPKMIKWADILKDPPLPPMTVADVLEGMNDYYPPEALKLDYILPHEQLPPDLKTKSLLSILVLDVISPTRWFFLKYGNLTSFEDFMDDLQFFYNAEGSHLKMHPKTVLKNHLCAVEYVDPNNQSRDWCRARIREVNPDGTALLFFIDYGSRSTVKISELKYLHQNFGGYPAQAFRGTLYGVKPPHGETWPVESCKTLLKLVASKGIQAEVVEVDYEKFWVSVHMVDTNTTEDIIISSVLVEKGLAKFSLFEEEIEEEKSKVQEDRPEEISFTDWKSEDLVEEEPCQKPEVFSSVDQAESFVQYPVLQNSKDSESDDLKELEVPSLPPEVFLRVEQSAVQLPLLENVKVASGTQSPVSMSNLPCTPPPSASAPAMNVFDHQFAAAQYGHQTLPPAQVWYNNQLPVQQQQPNFMNGNWQYMTNNWPPMTIQKKPPPGFIALEHFNQTFRMQAPGLVPQAYQMNFNQPQRSTMDFVHSQMPQMNYGCAPQLPQMGIGHPPPHMNFSPQISQAQLQQNVMEFFMMTQAAQSGQSRVVNSPSVPVSPWWTNPSAVYNPPPIASSSSQAFSISELPPSPARTPTAQSDSHSENSSRPDSQDISVQTIDDSEEASNFQISAPNANAEVLKFSELCAVASEKTSLTTDATKTFTMPLATLAKAMSQGDSSRTFESGDACEPQGDQETAISSARYDETAVNSAHYDATASSSVLYDETTGSSLQCDETAGSSAHYDETAGSTARYDETGGSSTCYEETAGSTARNDETGGSSTCYEETAGNLALCDELLQLDLDALEALLVDGSSRDADVCSFIYRSDDDEDDYDDNDSVEEANECEEVEEPEDPKSSNSASHVALQDVPRDVPTDVLIAPEQLFQEARRPRSRSPEVPPVPAVVKDWNIQLISVGKHRLHLITVQGNDYVSTAELNATYALFSAQSVLLNILTSMSVHASFLELSRIKWKGLFEDLDLCCDVAGIKKANGRLVGKMHLTPVDAVASVLRAVSKNAKSQINEFETWKCQLETT
ncbi:uncharacterized protein LOC134534955 isoform X2 [Bacillus rossius redtenbacheri]|uniref:uncharacterized protein LOC134534955 isoform X2 n=1 Tax=Bacillus rossius redtenbacheri TaxID=93214 RepID=UPI002FDE4413